MTPPTDSADGDLMSRLQHGDDRALDLLMDRWQLPVRRFIYRWLQNDADALDLAQETFVRVYRHCHRFRTGAKFSTWLFAIALNLCRNHARRGKNRFSVPLDETPELEAAGNAPNTDLLRMEKIAAVRKAVDALPEPLKTATLLCEYEEFSLAEAAAAENCSPKAIETRLYRARQLLRHALDRYF
ncbi:MAG: sigma-70 family RNA polymerase sigma factor [Verrucomicrobiota bacterium]|nr:sigma-70 family RNA polymerase sigma factor [Verrucomicrobiota bacterium]